MENQIHEKTFWQLIVNKHQYSWFWVSELNIAVILTSFTFQNLHLWNLFIKMNCNAWIPFSTSQATHEFLIALPEKYCSIAAFSPPVDISTQTQVNTLLQPSERWMEYLSRLPFFEESLTQVNKGEDYNLEKKCSTAAHNDARFHPHRWLFNTFQWCITEHILIFS